MDGGTERGAREDARVPLYQRIRARGMPRRVSINSRRGANSCHWNARWSRGEKSLDCVPFIRPATGFPIGDSSLIRRRGVSNRARPNDHLGCVTRMSLHHADHGIAPRFPRLRGNFGGKSRSDDAADAARGKIYAIRRQWHLKCEQVINYPEARLIRMFDCRYLRIKNIFLAFICC